jgi:hypothetical protein
MPFPTIGQPMPRAANADATADKWQGRILATAGHRQECERVFHAGPPDGERIWAAIAAAILHAPVSVIRDRAPHGVVCGADITLTTNDRTASVATAWHHGSPRRPMPPAASTCQ